MSDEWLKAQGLGRERFSVHLQSFLNDLGFRCEAEERDGGTEVKATLARMNPSIPPGVASLRFRFVPTAGGSALFWPEPREVPVAELSRADRFGKELEQHLLRVALAESHGTAKVKPAVGAQLPWRRPLAGPSPPDEPPTAGL